MKTNLKLISSILYLIISVSIGAQNIKISGRIIDSQEKPIFAANVYIKNNLEKGTTSDLDGNFVLDINHNNMKDTLIVSFIGFEKKEIALDKLAISKQVNIQLKEEQTVLSEIVVRINPSLSKEFSIQSVSKLEIYSTPTSSGDALKMITTLPASTNTSESANPELRGSSSDMSRVVLNDVPIYNPVRNSQISGMGNFSLLNTELINELNIYASNPPLIYGNSTAGLVEIETTKELANNQTQLAVSLANIGLLHSLRLNKKSFIQLYGNYQFSKPYIFINKKNIANLDNFTSKDFGVNLHVKANKKLSLNLYSYFIDENYSAQENMYAYYGDMLAGKKRNFNILNIKYKTDKTVFSYSNGTNFSVTEYTFGNINSKQTDRQLYNSIDAKHFINESVYIQAGISSDYTKIDFSSQFPYFYYAVSPNDSSYKFDNKINNHNIEAFLYGRWKVSRKITFGGGIRKNIPDSKRQRSFLSFQSSLRYTINKNHSMLLSGGKYCGYSVPLFYIQEFTPIISKQFSLEYRYNTAWLQLGSSLYFKDEIYSHYYSDIGKIQKTNKHIKGLEFFGEKTIDKLRFCLSYTYLHSMINRDGKWHKATNKMDYLLKFSTTYSNLKYGTIGLSFMTRPGHYYTPIVGALKNNEVDAYEPVSGKYNTEQYSGYSSLDFSYNKLFKHKNNHIVCFINIRNILNKNNTKSVVYNSDYSLVNSYQYYQKRLFYCGVQFYF